MNLSIKAFNDKILWKMNSLPLVSINIVVLNGSKYASFCLESILSQSYPHELLEVNIIDNGSADNTKDICEVYGDLFIQSGFAKFELIKSDRNLGVWPGHEKLLETSFGKYIVASSIDIIFNNDFVANSVSKMESDQKIGALQPKTYKWEIVDGEAVTSKIIDSCGFEIFRSRRITNIGHGQLDEGQFSQPQLIFAVEGACPVLRRTTLEDIKIDGQIVDPEYFWYGDDLDFAWRMTLFGWHQIFDPSAVAFHDRQTTKNLSASHWDFVKNRKMVPMNKRRLDWKNVRFTIIKNDYIMNFLKDLPYILRREIGLLGYLFLFEFPVFLETFTVLFNLPKLLNQRRQVMSRSQISARQFRQFIK